MTARSGTPHASLRLAGLGGVLLALTLAGLALHVPGADSVGSVARTNVFVAIMAVAGLAYLAAIRLVLRAPAQPGAVWLVLAIAIGLRGVALAAPPFLSSDLYRYVWDGRVQLAGINPYRFVPADPALAALRDAAIYPRVNRAGYALTIYPPVAQLVFAAIAKVSQTAFAAKAAMVLFEALAAACLLRLLAIARLPPARLLIYAWNPLAVWSFAGNGHVDAVAIGFAAAALLASVARRDGWAGAALGAAVAVKFLPLAIAPALWRRWDWRAPAACIAVIACGYLWYAGAGWRVLGFLPGYAGEEGIGPGGNGAWLLAGLGEVFVLPRWASPLYLALAAFLLLALGLRIALRSRPAHDPARDAVRTCGAAGILASGLTVAISPHYSWYFAWLAMPACLCPIRSVIYLGVAPLLLDLDPLHERFVWPSLVYVPALILAFLDLRRRATGRTFAAPRIVGESS